MADVRLRNELKTPLGIEMVKYRRTGTDKLASMNADWPNEPAASELPPIPDVVSPLPRLITLLVASSERCGAIYEIRIANVHTYPASAHNCDIVTPIGSRAKGGRR